MQAANILDTVLLPTVGEVWVPVDSSTEGVVITGILGATETDETTICYVSLDFGIFETPLDEFRQAYVKHRH